MYHWYLLLRTPAIDNKLIAQNESKLIDSVDNQTKIKWFLIGLLEMTPIIGGTGLYLTANPIIFPFDYVIIGIILAILIAVLTKGKNPKAPIGIKETTNSF